MPVSALPSRLDVAAFVRNGDTRAGQSQLRDFPRLAASVWPDAGDPPIAWTLTAEERAAADGVQRPAVHVEAAATLPLTCQRCLDRVDLPVRVDRHFLFVADEALAAALDADAEDDVLALADGLDVARLLEDELLLALPMIPRHVQCPAAPRMSARTPDFDQEAKTAVNPFSALAGLKRH